MAELADLVQVEPLRKLTAPENYDWGVERSSAGEVEIVDLTEQVARGRVEGQEAEVRTTADILEWSCSCGDADPSMCRHVVAVAVETWRRTPPRAGA